MDNTQINTEGGRISKIIAFLLVLIGILFLVAIEHLLPIFTKIFFGQTVLTWDTSSFSPRAYQSAEFVLNQVELAAVDRGVYIKIQDDVLFRDPHYVGFPRVDLTEAEILHYQRLFSDGRLFDQNHDGSGFHCVTGLSGQHPALVPCAAGEEYQDLHSAYRFEAITNQEVGVLQIYLTNGQLVEIRIYPTENGIAFTPYEKAGDWWFDGISSSSNQLDEISSRLAAQPIEVLWPEKTSAQANARGLRIIGKQYRLAQEAIQNSDDVQKTFGEIQDIRPAIGNNSYSSWMDSTSVMLTFHVRGSHGEGAVIANGLDCFDLLIVFEGKPVKSSIYYNCP
jgi:hypothetical protein